MGQGFRQPMLARIALLVVLLMSLSGCANITRSFESASDACERDPIDAKTHFDTLPLTQAAKKNVNDSGTITRHYAWLLAATDVCTTSAATMSMIASLDLTDRPICAGAVDLGKVHASDLLYRAGNPEDHYAFQIVSGPSSIQWKADEQRVPASGDDKAPSQFTIFFMLDVPYDASTYGANAVDECMTQAVEGVSITAHYFVKGK